MSLFTKENTNVGYQVAWWLCVVTLPWVDVANNISLILLVLIWIAEGNFRWKWQKLKSSTWVLPFLLYYLMLMIGLIYTADVDNGFFTLDKKITFLVLPIIAATGKKIDLQFFSLLKRSFVYSCGIIIIFCIVAAAYYYMLQGTASNFDIRTNENFRNIHPTASSVWMHFSYIQLVQWAGLHPVYFSMYLVFCLTILFTENYSGYRDKIIHFMIACFIVCFLALLASRIAIVAFGCSALYLSIRKIQEQKIKDIIPIAFISFVVGLFLWLNPVARFRVIEEPMITTYQADKTVTNWNSVSYRLLEWKGSWSIIQSNWFTGVGTGGSKKSMDNFYAHYNRSTVGLEHNAHNQYLQTWMESGVLGLIAFLACLSVGLFSMRKNSSYASFILIFSVMCLTESIGERQKGVVFFTLFQVLFLGLETSKK